MKFAKNLATAVATLVQLIALSVANCLLLLILVPVGIGTFLIWMCAFFGIAMVVVAGITKLLDHHAAVRPELYASAVLLFGAMGIYVVIIGGASIAVASRSIIKAKIKALVLSRR